MFLQARTMILRTSLPAIRKVKTDPFVLQVKDALAQVVVGVDNVRVVEATGDNRDALDLAVARVSRAVPERGDVRLTLAYPRRALGPGEVYNFSLVAHINISPSISFSRSTQLPPGHPL